MNVFYEHDLVIYPLKVWVTNSNDKVWLNKRFTSVKKDPDPFDVCGDIKYDAMVSNILINNASGKYGVLLILNTEPDNSIIAHEASHITDKVFKHISERKIGTEARAYLLEFIFKCIESDIEQIKNKTKTNE